jgi:hypothetical protein
MGMFIASLFTCQITNHKPGSVAHAYNPSYVRGRSQEDHGSRLAQEKVKPPLNTEAGCGGTHLPSQLHESH